MLTVWENMDSHCSWWESTEGQFSSIYQNSMSQSFGPAIPLLESYLMGIHFHEYNTVCVYTHLCLCAHSGNTGNTKILKSNLQCLLIGKYLNKCILVYPDYRILEFK